MATLSTASQNFAGLVNILVQKKVEDALNARMVYTTPDSFETAEYVKGGNGSFRFAAYAALAVNTTALTEGAPPTAQTLAIDYDTFSATQMGWTVEITDLALLQNPHNLIAVGADRISWQAAASYNEIVRQAIAAGTSIKYSNGSARSTVSAIITGALVKKMVAFLEDSDVPRFADGYYRAVIHPRQKYDLVSDTASGGWMDVNKYVDNNIQTLLAGEVGYYAGVRFLTSTICTRFQTSGASSVDVISATFFGPSAYAIGDMQTLEARFVPPGGDHSDPLGQKAIVGAKVAVGAGLLDANGARYVNLETAATILKAGEA